MNESRTGADGDPNQSQRQDRLDSWKKIAAYLKREVSTVQRWERREGMPVHRHLHDKLGSVFAFRSELDAWWESRRLRLEPAADAEPGSVSPAQAPASRSRSTPLWIAAACVLVAALGVWLVSARNHAWRDPLAGARFVRLAEFAGTAQAAALSRAGDRVAFVGAHDSQTDVWAGDIGSGTYRNLTGNRVGELGNNPALRTLGFSPDSSLIWFWVRRGNGSAPGDVNIFAASADGDASPRLYLPEIAEVDWSRDGRRLVYHTTSPGDPIFVREAPGGADRRIYVAPAGVHCHFPLWSPDGAFIYFVRGVPPAGEWDVWRIRPSGAGLERITNHNTRVSYPVLLDARTLLYLATEADGSGPRLYGIDVEQRIPHRLSAGLESYSSLGASADGSRLVATIATLRTSLWRVALGAPGAAPGSSSRPLPVVPGAGAPRLGPDFLLYVSRGSGQPGLWTRTGGTTREIWRGPAAGVVGSPAISRDGLRIAFSVVDQGRTRLYAMDRDGSRLRVLADGLALRGSPAWSPDGSSVVVAELRDGEPRLTRFLVGGAAPLPLLSEYSLDPAWSPDGRFLIYTGADVGTTFPVRAAAADGRPYPLPGLVLTRGARRVAFLAADNPRSLVVLRGGVGHKDFGLVDLDTGGERTLVELPADFIVSDFDVAPDGSQIVFERVEESSEMALIERGG